MTPMGYGKRIDWLNRNKEPIDIWDSKVSNDKIVLFDMDGTLTAPREKFDRSLFSTLGHLSDKSEIGIVTGSDFEYLSEQMDYVLNSHLRYRLHLLPCNGTKYYPPPSNSSDKYELLHSANMKEKIGEEDFNMLMISLIQMQANFDLSKFPLSGHFFQYRDSMINWCPIGRNATSEDRKRFIEYDKSLSPTFRERVIGPLVNKLSLKKISEKITVKFGGDTSFDIFPKGWDKTYALKHFKNRQVWFVGDRCNSGGNDKEIYDLILKEDRAFKTKNPFQTELLIKENIIPFL